MAQIKSISFSSTDTLHGCACDRCGQWIKNIWQVSYGDGVSLNYGIDCFERLCKDSRLNAYGEKVMKKALRKIKEHQKELDAYINGEMNADNDLRYKAQQEWGGYWKDKPFEEYRAWMINEVFPQRFKEDQKEIDRFAKINFKR